MSLGNTTFKKHILNRHPEITPKNIRDCIENAHRVERDENYENRKRYFRMIRTHPVKDANHFTNLKVVVEEKNDGPDEVVTAQVMSDLRNESPVKGGNLYDAAKSSDDGSN